MLGHAGNISSEALFACSPFRQKMQDCCTSRGAGVSSIRQQHHSQLHRDLVSLSPAAKQQVSTSLKSLFCSHDSVHAIHLKSQSSLTLDTATAKGPTQAAPGPKVRSSLLDWSRACRNRRHCLGLGEGRFRSLERFRGLGKRILGDKGWLSQAL